jgi:hypothetical protein
MSASQAPFVLPEYTGDSTDLNYLKNWVLDQVETIYNVSGNVFDQATIYSTSILRDFVHRALYQETGREDISQITADGDLQYPQTQDVATAFRYPAYGLCGLMAWQEYQVFRAFGYQARDISTLNNNVDVYSDSHVTTEVYLNDLNKYIIQDATFNFLLQDNRGNYLSYDDAREDIYDGGPGLAFNSFNNYRSYFTTLTYEPTTSTSLQNLFNESYFKVPYWSYGPDGSLNGLTQTLFPDMTTAHVAGSAQGGTFHSDYDALLSIYTLQAAGNDWQSIANQLRSEGYYVSGFALANDTQDIISHWLTVRTEDGLYISSDIDHHTDLNGSLDQLENSATGGTDLNYGRDVSIFLNPAYILSYNGILQDGFVPDPGAHVAEFGDLVLRNVNSGMVKLWDLPDTSNLNLGVTISSTSDTGFAIAGYGDYVGDYQHDILFYKASNGQVGFWNDNAHWTGIGSMSTAWSIVSSDDHSDFTGDGADDILWHNGTTGALGFWDLSNGTNEGFQPLSSAPVSQWQVAATNDFNGDGTDDVFWQNTSTAEVREWLVSNGAVTQNIGFIGPAGFKIVGTADITHDGSADVIWENPSTGAVGYWNMLNGQNTGYHALGTVPTNWTVAAIRDMTADGTPDINWQDSTGHLTVWNLDHAADTTPKVVAEYLGAHASDWVVA